MRKRTVILLGILSLIFGFLLGTIFPQKQLPWGIGRGQAGTDVQPAALFSDSSPVMGGENAAPGDQNQSKSTQSAEFSAKDNFPLLNSACAVVRALQQRDYDRLAAYVHPEQGLTITPYSTVSLEDDLKFTADQVEQFGQDTNRYTWGVVAGTGELMQMTIEDFFSSCLFDVDYTQATRIGVDRVNITGNALENVTEAYPGCRFVEFTCAGSDAAGQDWRSLKLVFMPTDGQWKLVGLIHSEWTV